jgi:dolichyl-phosphate-mannose-protein mannosyltransferase
VSPSPFTRRDATGMAGLLALAWALRAAGLAAQPLNADDLSVLQTARAYAAIGLPEPTMWNHPRLRDLLVNLSLDALGEGAWGIKAWSVLLSVLAVPALFLLLRRLAPERPVVAWLGAALLAADPFQVHFARQGIQDAYLTFFPVAGLAAALRYRDVRGTGWLLLSGLLFGLGLASKWSTLFSMAFALGWLALDAWRAPPAGSRLAPLALVAAALLLLPLTTYLLTWWPWFGRGYSLAEWLDFQRAMALETATHAGYPGTKLPGFYGEQVGAWRWFLAPCWFVDLGLPTVGTGTTGMTFLVGVGNPLTWLLVLPGLALAAWRGWRHREPAGALLAALFLVNYLPFLSPSRPIFSNSAVAVLPYGLALAGYAAAAAWDRSRALVAGWVALAALAGVLLVTASVGRPPAPARWLVGLLVPPEAYESKTLRLEQSEARTAREAASPMTPPPAAATRPQEK